MFERVRRDPGGALLVLALVAAAALYLPTVGRGLVNYDDTWLVRDNQVVQDASAASLRTIFFDLDSPHRYQLTPEYLPVRDLSVMADFAIWGDHYGGFHLTSTLVYLAAIALWFAALCAFGIDRRIVGLAVLVWALHPSHAESVAWLSERKGVLGMMFAGACALGYARFRAGRGAWWLALGVACGVAAVWSKATAAFAVAALVGLELALPALRRSWRRSLGGLAAIGGAAALAYIPVLILAVRWSVVGGGDAVLPASRAAMVVGVHGFYLRLGAATIADAVAYPISTDGPTAVDLAVGALGLALVLAVAFVPRVGRWTPPPELRAAAALWLFGWLPVSHLVLPLQMVFVADRYLLIPSLGLALAVAIGVARVPTARVRVALATAIVLALSVRALDAQLSWRGIDVLWERAVASNPHDGNAWSMYLEALEDTGHPDLAREAVDRGLAYTRLPRLVMHKALLALADGDTITGFALMRDAAEHGEPRAMANLAKLLLDRGELDAALAWARRATIAAPTYANGHRMRGKIALAADRPDEALAAFQHALAFEPTAVNRFNLALALLALHRPAEARTHLEACLADPALWPRASAVLRALPDH